MSFFRTLTIAFEDMVVGIEGSFADMASMMIDPFQSVLHASISEDEDMEHGQGNQDGEQPNNEEVN